MDTEYALKMREIADNVNERNEATKKQIHMEFIENEILPRIERLANYGKYSMGFYLPTNYSGSLCTTLLESIGFTVENDCNRIKISW